MIPSLLPLLCVAIGALIALAGPLARRQRLVAMAFLALSALIVAVQLFTLTRAAGVPLAGVARGWVGPLELAWRLLLGMTLTQAVMRSAAPWNTAGAWALIGLSAYVAGKFLYFDIGKALHQREMEAFFIASGLPVWLHYAVMAAEVAGSLGLLLHARLRTGPAATAGLALIMLAAIHTHWRNHDPLPDSHDAFRQLAYLVVLYGLERRARRRTSPSDTD